MRSLLAAPLAAKLAGANALIVIAAIAVASVNTSGASGDMRALAIIAGGLALSLVMNLLLVTLALRPLRQVEATVERVWLGDLDARVPESRIADRNVERVGRTLNLLLDGLASDRDRMRRLARQVISASDTERARVARSLHDSAAQALAALAFQASAAAHDGRDTDLGDRLQTIKDLSTSILDEVRVLGQALYPRVLDDLGLPSALNSLALDAEQRSPSVSVSVNVDDPDAARRIPAEVASVLYHVAREGVANAIKHGDADDIDVRMSVADNSASLTVADNGRGFDVDGVERDGRGAGIFGMRERLALIQGRMSIISRAGDGTQLSVSVPLNQVSHI
jgi:signal transduction histidine kinase